MPYKTVIQWSSMPLDQIVLKRRLTACHHCQSLTFHAQMVGKCGATQGTYIEEILTNKLTNVHFALETKVNVYCLFELFIETLAPTNQSQCRIQINACLGNWQMKVSRRSLGWKVASFSSFVYILYRMLHPSHEFWIFFLKIVMENDIFRWYF